MKIYVATAYGNREEARSIMGALLRAGHSISHDWTNDQLDPEWSPEDQAAYLRESGRRDYIGVTEADAIVLVNHRDSRDAMTEFGLSLGMDKMTFVLYPARRNSVFFSYARPVESVQALLAALGEP